MCIGMNSIVLPNTCCTIGHWMRPCSTRLGKWRQKYKRVEHQQQHKHMKLFKVDSVFDEPDIKVRIVPSKFDADAVVRFVSAEFDSDGELNWYFVNR